ncbi:MAG: FtsJ-like methyltransferase family protein [Thermoplasmata archaeon]
MTTDEYGDMFRNGSMSERKSMKKTIKKILSIIRKKKLSEVLILNPYEKMIPFNLWFYHPEYKVVDYFENNQHLRIRYFRNAILTPLVAANYPNLIHMKSFLEDLSIYQPFYPETFFIMWEFLQTGHLGLDSHHFLHIGRRRSFGTVEAIILYHERYQIDYQLNSYDIWLAGNEVYDNIDGSYRIITPKIDYLSQIYYVNFLHSTHELSKYDFVSLDCNHLFHYFFEWRNEETDLYANIFYILTAMKHLKRNGSMIIRLNMIMKPIWYLVFDIFHEFFMEYVFLRPQISNIFNPEIYLFLNKFRESKNIDSIFNRMLRNLYRQKVDKFIYLDVPINTDNPITLNFSKQVKIWTKILDRIIHGSKVETKKRADLLEKWHLANDLKQIKQMDKEFDNSTKFFSVKTSTVIPWIKPVKPDSLYNISVYRKLLEKRAELNYYKRVMDTKPSTIFTSNKTADSSYFLTWEQLMSIMNLYKKIKRTLLLQYRAEVVSNAWLKLYEILNIFADLIPIKETIKTFHLCEAPGAFILATNHYISNRGGTRLEWYAQSLNPFSKSSNSMLGDQYGLMSRYPERWLFGSEEDNSGDVTHSAVIRSYAKNPLLKEIDFMTSDAGISCNPRDLNEQESRLAKVNMGQIIGILACLSPGRSAIFKTFLPMAEPLTISLMYLLTHLFQKVTIVKPSASHSSNSEVYVVLKNYKGISPKMLNILYDLLDDPKITSKSLFFAKIEPVFFNAYVKGISSLIDRQIRSLCMNYYYYYHLDELLDFDKNWVHKLSPLFMFNRRYKITPLLRKSIDNYTEEWFRNNPVSILKKPLLRKPRKMW